MATMLTYFLNKEAAQRALDEYLIFANSANWPIGGPYGKLRLYSLGRTAFDPEAADGVAEAAFNEAYRIVRSWPGIQRGGALADPLKVYDALLLLAPKFLGTSQVNLADLAYPSPDSHAISTHLHALSFVKPTKTYPWMAVSKVLHFCNPALFPIWDWEVMWNKVMWGGSSNAPFRSDYVQFCRHYDFKPTTNEPEFVLYYALWAGSYIEQGSPEFMIWFAEWLRSTYPADVARLPQSLPVTELYATAFEFIAIGAALLEQE